MTRTRWLLTKFGAQLAIALLAFAILVPATLYSLGPLGGHGSLDPITIDVEGFVPLAYLAFAFALALAAGTVLRTTLPAMFATLVGYCTIRFAVLTYARPSFLPPVTTIWDPSKGDSILWATAGPSRSGWLTAPDIAGLSGRRQEGGFHAMLPALTSLRSNACTAQGS